MSKIWRNFCFFTYKWRHDFWLKPTLVSSFSSHLKTKTFSFPINWLWGPTDVNLHPLWLYLQSTWRKIQSLGLVQEYNANEEVKLFCGMLDGLSFLPLAQVEEGMEFLLQNVPNIQGNNWAQCQSTHYREGRVMMMYQCKQTAMRTNWNEKNARKTRIRFATWV